MYRNTAAAAGISVSWRQPVSLGVGVWAGRFLETRAHTLSCICAWQQGCLGPAVSSPASSAPLGSLSAPLLQKIKSDLRTGNGGWKCQLLMDLYVNLRHHKVLPYLLLFLSFEVMSNSFSIPWTVAHPSGDGVFPGRNTGVGCHFLFQGVFLIQGLNPSLLHW